MTTRDDKIGANLARLRGNVSQEGLAKAMRDRGYRWSQATVWAIEKGERPLRLSEAEDATAILGKSVQDLTASEAIVALKYAASEVRRHQGAVSDALQQLFQDELTLASALDAYLLHDEVTEEEAERIYREATVVTPSMIASSEVDKFLDLLRHTMSDVQRRKAPFIYRKRLLEAYEIERHLQERTDEYIASKRTPHHD